MSFFKKIKGGIYNGIGFMLIIGLSSVAYGAYVALTDVTSGGTLTSSLFNQVLENVRTIKTTVDGLSNVPVGAVMAFYGNSCPTGWTLADGSGDEKKVDGTFGTLDLRGEFIRGLDNSRGVDSGRTLASSQGSMFTSHHHAQATQNGLVGNRESGNTVGQGMDYADGYGEVPTSDVGGTETRPRNVALLYCVKQ